MSKTDELRQIKDEIVNLTESPLYAFRKAKNYYPVIGVGNHDARFMFIGEAPGKTEASKGVPFVGAAGKVLDELLATIDLPREEIYITNILKDRPPENRDPNPPELDLYAPFLYRQIRIIQPRIIVTLGRFAMSFILKKLNLPQYGSKISDIHGSVIPATAHYGDIIVIPLYHPAMSLYKPETREMIFQDFLVLKEFKD